MATLVKLVLVEVKPSDSPAAGKPADIYRPQSCPNQQQWRQKTCGDQRCSVLPPLCHCSHGCQRLDAPPAGQGRDRRWDRDRRGHCWWGCSFTRRTSSGWMASSQSLTLWDRAVSWVNPRLLTNSCSWTHHTQWGQCLWGHVEFSFNQINILDTVSSPFPPKRLQG